MSNHFAQNAIKNSATVLYRCFCCIDGSWLSRNIISVKLLGACLCDCECFVTNRR